MYGTVDQVAALFESDQWDPARHEPGTASVTAMLTRWSAVLDGQIGHLVSVPVDATDSPNLNALCAEITAMRVAAEVFDILQPPAVGEQYLVRRSNQWRTAAAELVKGIQQGATGDGVALRSGQAQAPGVPTSNFGETRTTMNQKF